MCGRSRVALSRPQVLAAAGVPEDRWKNPEKYVPSHNVAPGYYTPVMKRDKEGNIELHTQKWGLFPSYNKPDARPDHWQMFNARSETVSEKGVFKRLLSRQRCIVLLNGFYEWAKEGKQKQPYYIHLGEGRVLKVAGLFDHWQNAEGETVYTYTILTTDSSKRLQWLHNRMPVILADTKAEDMWLQAGKPLTDSELAELCTPYNGEDLVWHPVGSVMSKMGYQEADCAKPLTRQSIAKFFAPAGKQKAGSTGTASAVNSDEVPKDTRVAAKQVEVGVDAAKNNVKKEHGAASEVTVGPQSPAQTWPIMKQERHGSRAEPTTQKPSIVRSTAGIDNPETETVCEEATSSPEQHHRTTHKPPDAMPAATRHPKTRSAPAKASPAKKAKVDAAAAGSSKITSFFTKKPS